MLYLAAEGEVASSVASGVSKGGGGSLNLLASKIRSLNNSFSSLLGQNSLLCQPAIDILLYLQERVSEGRGQRFWGVA